MLSLRTFKGDHAHLVVRHYDDAAALDVAARRLIKEHYAHIELECLQWLANK